MVLATTRSELVAQRLCATKPYFHLQGMSDESALVLFKKIAFADEEDWNNSKLDQLGRQIVRKCANVPLAIVTIASLLREEDKEHWVSLVNDELSKVFPDEYKKITHVLEISYKELPYPIKRCFEYCSLFLKGYEFEKVSLVRLWIAQGFVEPLVNRSLEDRAEKYFFYLVNRCFFQLTTRDEDMEGIVTCQMHDMMHDLATQVAEFECMLVDRSADSPWDKVVRHMSINYDSKSMVDRVCSFSHSKSLRTFLCPCRISLGKNALKKLMYGFRSLRVMDLSDLGIEKVPTSIGELIHLRFLDLSMNHMIRLPSSICSLRHLQSLILRDCNYLIELPEELGDLLSLRHLVLQDCDSLVKMPTGLAALTSLVTLDNLVVHNPNGGLKYLEGLDNLTGSLQIMLPSTEWESATSDAERSSLSRKTSLHALYIIHDYTSLGPDTWMNALQPPPTLVKLEIHHFGGKEMPLWVTHLHELVVLKLFKCERCVELPPLSHLPSLKELHIQFMPSMLSIEDSKFYKPNSFFLSLETLLIEFMPNLTSWWLQPPTVLPTFPRLTRVIIQDCPQLTRCMPLFTPVEHLQFKSVREELIWHVIGSESDSVLKKLEMREIGDLSSIAEAQIRHLVALRNLSIRGCTWIQSVSSNGLAYLTSLEHLEICGYTKFNCDGHCRIQLPRLKHLEVPTVNMSLFKGLKYMASLETLIIHQGFDEELQEEGMSPWQPLQKLRHMELAFGETFSMRTNKCLPHGFEDLTSLIQLTLMYCKELYLSWSALLGLPNLHYVSIEHVEEVIDVDSDDMTIQTKPISHCIRGLVINGGSGEWVNDIPWKSFPFLEELDLLEIRNLDALPLR